MRYSNTSCIGIGTLALPLLVVVVGHYCCCCCVVISDGWLLRTMGCVDNVNTLFLFLVLLQNGRCFTIMLLTLELVASGTCFS